MDLNRVQLIGRLTQDPELRQTPAGASVVSFSVATNFQYKDKNSGDQNKITEYHNCVAWRGLADTIGRYLKKGSRAFLEGRLQTRSWDDPSGVKKYKTEIVVDNMIMLDSKGGAMGDFGGGTAAQDDFSLPTRSPEPDGDEISIDEVPF